MIIKGAEAHSGNREATLNAHTAFAIEPADLKLITERYKQLKEEGFDEGPEEYMGCSGCVEGERRCGIIITKKCQLKCTYCYEKGKNATTIDVNLAKRILREELTDRKDVRRVHIDLFGGEPFLAFNVIRELVDYLEKNAFETDYFITTITNGMAIHGEIQDWLVEHRGIIECPLSLDGTRDMQERNRPGSFDRIDLDFFAREFPGTRAKMTVSNSTIGQLAEGTVFLHEHGFSPKNGIAYGTDWDEGSDEILVRELGKLIEYYLDNPKTEESLMLKIPYRDICVRRRRCDASKNMVMYDVDGTKWPCHMFLPMSIGEEKARGVAAIDFTVDGANGGLCDDACKFCVINNSCVVCQGTNYSELGTLMGKNEDVCRFTKIIYRAKAFLAMEKWKMGFYDQLTQSDELLLLKSISLCAGI